MNKKLSGLSRREFLKRIITAAGATVTIGGISYVATTGQEILEKVVAKAPEKTQWARVIDLTKCTRCGTCVEACVKENRQHLYKKKSKEWINKRYSESYADYYANNPMPSDERPRDWIPSRLYWNKMVTYSGIPSKGAQGNRKNIQIPSTCMHCRNPPCVAACPLRATWRRDDGVVVVDQDVCMGCRACIAACPYGARVFSERFGVVTKCNLCKHRIKKGKESDELTVGEDPEATPRCDLDCPFDARFFGNINDPNSNVASKVANNPNAVVLLPEQGTDPSTYYILGEKP